MDAGDDDDDLFYVCAHKRWLLTGRAIVFYVYYYTPVVGGWRGGGEWKAKTSTSAAWKDTNWNRDGQFGAHARATEMPKRDNGMRKTMEGRM